MGIATSPRPPWTAGRVAATATTLAVVAVVFAGVLPQLADYGDVAASMRAVPTGGVLLLLALTAAHLSMFALVLSTVVPGLGRRQALAVHTSSTAVANTVPAGGAVAVAVQYAGLARLGYSMSSVTPGLAAAGLWDNGGRVLLLAAGAGVTALLGGTLAGLLGGAGLVLLLGLAGLLAAALTSDRLLLFVAAALTRPVAFVRRRSGHPPMDVPARLVVLRRDLTMIARLHWPRLTVLTALYHLSLFALLLGCLRMLGVDASTVSWLLVLPVYALARVVTVVPVTPGGVGIVELGYVALLSANSTPETTVTITAAVLLFRALSYLLPIPLGVAAWLLLPRLAGGPRRLVEHGVG